MKHFIYTFSFLIIFSFSLFAGNKADLKLINSNEIKTTIEVKLNGVNSEKKLLDNNEYDFISLDNKTSLGEIGQASLPIITEFIRIPNGKDITIAIKNYNSVLYNNYNIIPYQELPLRNQTNNNFAKDNQYYSTNKFFPEQIVIIKEIVLIGDIRVAIININPVQFNPVTKELKVYTNILFELNYSGHSGLNNPLVINRGHWWGMEKLYRDIIFNYQPSPDTFSAPPNMIIIAADGLYNGMEPFVTWKNIKGLSTVIIKKSELGFGENPTADNIKQYIIQQYNGTNSPEFVMLIGEAVGTHTIPWFTVGSSKSDHPYSCVSGTDIIPDIVIGRISVNSETELSNALTRLIQYESNPLMTDTAWYKKAMVCFSQDGIDPINGQVMKNLFLNEGGFTNVDMVAYNQGSAITGYKNAGLSWIWFIGHGSPTSWAVPLWHMSNMPNCTYGRMHPSTIAINCATADLDYSSGNCFAEEYTERNSLNTPSNYLGFTENCAFYTTDTLGRFMVYGYFRQAIYDFGSMMNYGKINAYTYFNGNSTVQGTINQTICIGDPTQEAYSDVPKTLTVTYNNTIDLMTINVKVNNSNVSKALVGVSQSNVLKASGYTDANGNFIVQNGVLSQGQPFTLVVTGKNLKAYENTFIPVSISGNVNKPEKFELKQNYPNPFNPVTNIKFQIAKDEFVSIKIFDVLGKEVSTIINENMKSGYYEVNFDATNLPSGVYFYRMDSGSFSEIKKMTFVK